MIMDLRAALSGQLLRCFVNYVWEQLPEEIRLCLAGAVLAAIVLVPLTLSKCSVNYECYKQSEGILPYVPVLACIAMVFLAAVYLFSVYNRPNNPGSSSPTNENQQTPATTSSNGKRIFIIVSNVCVTIVIAGLLSYHFGHVPSCWDLLPEQDMSKTVDIGHDNLLDDLFSRGLLSLPDRRRLIKEQNLTSKDANVISLIEKLEKNNDTFFELVNSLITHGYPQLAERICKTCEQCWLEWNTKETFLLFDASHGLGFVTYSHDLQETNSRGGEVCQMDKSPVELENQDTYTLWSSVRGVSTEFTRRALDMYTPAALIVCATVLAMAVCCCVYILWKLVATLLLRSNDNGCHLKSSTGESNMSVDTDTDFRDSQCNRSTQVNSNSVHTTAKNYDRVPRSDADSGMQSDGSGVSLSRYQQARHTDSRTEQLMAISQCPPQTVGTSLANRLRSSSFFRPFPDEYESGCAHAGCTCKLKQDFGRCGTTMVLQIDCGLLLATHNYEVNFFWRERQGDTFLTEVKETNVLCQQEDFALFCNVKIPEDGGHVLVFLTGSDGMVHKPMEFFFSSTGPSLETNKNQEKYDGDGEGDGTGPGSGNNKHTQNSNAAGSSSRRSSTVSQEIKSGSAPSGAQKTTCYPHADMQLYLTAECLAYGWLMEGRTTVTPDTMRELLESARARVSSIHGFPTCPSSLRSLFAHEITTILAWHDLCEQPTGIGDFDCCRCSFTTCSSSSNLDSEWPDSSSNDEFGTTSTALHSDSSDDSASMTDDIAFTCDEDSWFFRGGEFSDIYTEARPYEVKESVAAQKKQNTVGLRLTKEEMQMQSQEASILSVIPRQDRMLKSIGETGSGKLLWSTHNAYPYLAKLSKKDMPLQIAAAVEHFHSRNLPVVYGILTPCIVLEKVVSEARCICKFTGGNQISIAYFRVSKIRATASQSGRNLSPQGMSYLPVQRYRNIQRGENSRLREEQSAFLQQIEQSRKELSVQVQENDKQKTQLKAMKSQLRQLQTQNAEMTEQSKERTRQVEEVQVLITETENQIGQLCSKEAELQQENEEQATLVQSLREQTTQLGQTVTEQKSQLHDKQQAIDSLKLTAEKENEIKHINRENAELKELNRRLSQENVELLTHIQTLKQQEAELSETVRSQQTILHDQQQTIDSLTAENEEQIRNLTRENAEFRQNNDELRQHILELKQQNQEQLTHIQSLQQQASGLGQTVSSQQTQLHNKQQAIDSLKLTAEKENEIKHINSEEAELKEVNTMLSQENVKLLTHIQSLQQQASRLGQTVSSQQIQLYNKQQTIDCLTAEKEERIQDLAREKAELKEDNARVSQENERNLTHIQSLEQQAAKLHQTVSLQQTQLLQKQVAIDTLTEEKAKHIQDISRRNAELRQQSEEQSTRIESPETVTAKIKERIQQLCRENAQLRAEQIQFISGDTGTGDRSGADSSDRSLKPITVSVSEKIGEERGMANFQSSKVSLYVPEGAVPPVTTFSLKPYVDPCVLSPLTSKDEVTLSPAFQLSSSLPQGHLSFKKPLLLSLPSEVPLSASDRDNGWLLQLKRSESSDSLPDEWHTCIILEINTKTVEVISHSSNSQYDPDSHMHAVYLWLSWIGRPLETVGNVVGSSSSSLRDINYAVFGKQIQHHKWLSAAHILHKSETVYKSLVHNLREEGYVQLNHPNTDCIGFNGEVSFQVECKTPWQVQQGKPEVKIKTSQIWGSGQHSSCYHEFTIEDHTCSADTLEFTIEASFQAQGERDAGHPVQLIVSHPLCAPQPTICTATESGVSDEFHDPQLVLSAVLKHGPEYWYLIGLKLGFTASQVKAITFAIPRDEDKLTALFETKANAIGQDEGAEQLLDACGTIPNPILGVVMEELTGASKEGRSEGKAEVRASNHHYHLLQVRGFDDVLLSCRLSDLCDHLEVGDDATILPEHQAKSAGHWKLHVHKGPGRVKDIDMKKWFGHVGVLGQFNRGKIWVMGHLSDYTFPNEGMSFKWIETKTTPSRGESQDLRHLVIDTSGFNTPITLHKPNSPSPNTRRKQRSKAGQTSGIPEATQENGETVDERVRRIGPTNFEKASTRMLEIDYYEQFLGSMTLSLSNYIIVVTNDTNLQEQKFLYDLVRRWRDYHSQDTSKCKDVFVVHNFRMTNTHEERKELFLQSTADIYEGKMTPIGGVSVFSCHSLRTRHVCLMNNETLVGKVYNDRVLSQMKVWIHNVLATPSDPCTPETMAIKLKEAATVLLNQRGYLTNIAGIELQRGDDGATYYVPKKKDETKAIKLSAFADETFYSKIDNFSPAYSIRHYKSKKGSKCKLMQIEAPGIQKIKVKANYDNTSVPGCYSVDVSGRKRRSSGLSVLMAAKELEGCERLLPAEEQAKYETEPIKDTCRYGEFQEHFPVELKFKAPSGKKQLLGPVDGIFYLVLEEHETESEDDTDDDKD